MDFALATFSSLRCNSLTMENCCRIFPVPQSLANCLHKTVLPTPGAPSINILKCLLSSFIVSCSVDLSVEDLLVPPLKLAPIDLLKKKSKIASYVISSLFFKILFTFPPT